MRRLWGRLSSVNVQKVAWALAELDLPCERLEAGGAHGVVDTPSYRALNPNGLVPTLEEDGEEGRFVLWESNAIVRYLAASHARGEGGIWPADPRVRAEADRWMDWQATTLTPAMRDAFWGLVRQKPAERDAEVIARSLAAGERAAEVLEAHLMGRAYLAGEAFSVADIAVGCAVHRWLNLPNAEEQSPRRPRPATRAWYARLAERPATRGVLVTPIT